MRDIFKAGKNIDNREFNNYIEKLIKVGSIDENVVASELGAIFNKNKSWKYKNRTRINTRIIKPSLVLPPLVVTSINLSNPKGSDINGPNNSLTGPFSPNNKPCNI